jgi:hypothetical protein
MFKVMFASALTDEAKWAALRQYVVRVGHIRDALESLVRWNEHHRAVRACQAAVDDALQQRMQQLQQQQHDGMEGVMVAAVLDAPLSALHQHRKSATTLRCMLQHFSIAIPHVTQSEQHAAIVRPLVASSPTSLPPEVWPMRPQRSRWLNLPWHQAWWPPPTPSEMVAGAAAGVRGVLQPHADVGPGGGALRIQTGSKPVALHSC